MKMAKMLIDTMSVDEFEPEKFTNQYHDELLAMIEARAAGKELPQAKKAPARSKVVNLMDVLAQSLEESKKRASRRAAGEKPRGQTPRRRRPPRLPEQPAASRLLRVPASASAGVARASASAAHAVAQAHRPGDRRHRAATRRRRTRGP